MGLGSAMAGGNPDPTRGREKEDFYPTPPEVTLALLRKICFPGMIWEPACGKGDMVRVLAEAGYGVFGSDKVDRCQPLDSPFRQHDFPFRQRDFLAEDPVPVPSHTSIVTNPPFELAVDFIEQALAHEPAMLALVLKATFWHAKRRRALFERTRPKAIYPLSWRVDFLGIGRPTMELIWCVWERGHTGPCTYHTPLLKPES